MGLKDKKISTEEGATLSDLANVIAVAEIVNHGTKMVLPEGMTLDQGIDLLKRRKTYMNEVVGMQESYNVFPWDGAHALDQVLTAKYGWSPAEATPGFFGDEPPQMIGIEVGYKKTKQVPWGRFSLPGVKGHIETSYDRKDGRYVFKLNAQVTRMGEPVVKELMDLLHKELELRSIYRGKAFKIRFNNDEGKPLPMPEPKFIDTNDISEDMLVYSDHVMAAINTNLFTPIRRVQDCVANGIPVKRGVLLGGPYGTGKTLAAKVASKLAVDNGVGYLYVQRADELADAVTFAKSYADPAMVIFCEDIDRAMDGERTKAMDDILNIIDGIDTKAMNIIVVLTTNHLDNINPAMLRPGRLDAVINVEAPDAVAVQKLLRYYGGKAIAPETDLTAVGAQLQGRIPAVIAEVVKRAKLAQLSLQAPGTLVTELTEEALVQSATTMESQLDLLYKERDVQPVTLDSVMQTIMHNATHPTAVKVDEIRERV